MFSIWNKINRKSHINGNASNVHVLEVQIKYN